MRFIPACAGNTLRSPSICRPSTVHPRLCGEHSSHNVSKNKDFRDQRKRTSFSSPPWHVDTGFQTYFSTGLMGCLIDHS